eukprot:CAMPEP_0113240766 /NCGR_PEP_ID=MMETSP0008_2-20120614/6442_1 /TAXON_ID=97485 /ORGANISM="Prymnesium parvum" /LENGTH=190 /DNA_ID=CAMNT_0000088137 /DNA_START=463 /DNA_END=1031 /DNA_ORIENTATION=+ /assembly_acc=CAM_ASM_000153
MWRVRALRVCYLERRERIRGGAQSEAAEVLRGRAVGIRPVDLERHVCHPVRRVGDEGAVIHRTLLHEPKEQLRRGPVGGAWRGGRAEVHVRAALELQLEVLRAHGVRPDAVHHVVPLEHSRDHLGVDEEGHGDLLANGDVLKLRVAQLAGDRYAEQRRHRGGAEGHGCGARFTPPDWTAPQLLFGLVKQR